MNTDKPTASRSHQPPRSPSPSEQQHPAAGKAMDPPIQRRRPAVRRLWPAASIAALTAATAVIVTAQTPNRPSAPTVIHPHKHGRIHQIWLHPITNPGTVPAPHH
jgi:hypothetical protein